MTFAPLPFRRGRIAYRARADNRLWGFEDWRIAREADGGRCLSVHCEMTLGEDKVVRDSVLAVDRDYQPREAYVRICNRGEWTGGGWFAFGEREAEGESLTRAEGRLTQRMPIARPMRGFGIHAVQGDGWLAAGFPFDKGAGHVHFAGRNLLHSLHHLGATGPKLEVSTSGLRYGGIEQVEVAAGKFDCHRLEFVGMTNDHPPYVFWLTTDGDFLFVKGTVEGYMDAVFLLEDLEGEPLG